MNITGKTKKLGILGCPVEHSFSPRLHNAAFAALKIDYVYVPLPVQPEELATAFAGMKTLGFVGANVTIPHKIAIMPMLDELDESAKLVGAVNTLVKKEELWIGYNTDAIGFIASLKNHQVDLTPQPVLILGAGGAARAVVAGLIIEGFQEFYFAVRRPAQVEPMKEQFKNAVFHTVTFNSIGYNDALSMACLIINTTPIGMSPRIDDMVPCNFSKLKADAVLCDLIYNPTKTAFLHEGTKRGHKVVSGQGMLVEQGLKAFELWTGVTGPRDLYYQEIRNIL